MSKRFKVGDLVVDNFSTRKGIGTVTAAEMGWPMNEGRRVQGQRRMRYTVWWSAGQKLEDGIINDFLEHYRGDPDFAMTRIQEYWASRGRIVAEAGDSGGDCGRR